MATCADKINPELHKSKTVHTKQAQKEIITPKCLHHSSLAKDTRLSGDEALTKKKFIAMYLKRKKIIDTLRYTTIYHHTVCGILLEFQDNLGQS